jgi:hypothetical protein
MKVSFFPMKQFCVHPLILTAALNFAVTAYAQQDTQQVEASVNEILSQMTLDEKINYISGAIVNFASLGGSAMVSASSDFTSEIDGIKAQAPGATVDYIAACVPDPATAVWQTGTGAAGLIGQYFNSNDLSGSPVATRVDTELNFTSFS